MSLQFPLFAACLFSLSDCSPFPTASPPSLNRVRQRAENFHFKKEQRSTSRPDLAVQLLGCSEPNSLLFLQIWFRQPTGALPIHLMLLASSQRSEDCMWPGCRNLHLWHGNSSGGTLKRQVHLSGTAPTTSWAKRLLLHLTLWLALCHIFGSTQALDLSVAPYFAWRTKAIPMSCSLPNTRALCSLQVSGPPVE